MVSGTYIANTDVSIAGIQNICPVAGRVHPGIYNSLRAGIALGNVFTGASEGDAEAAHHFIRCAVDWTVMGEVAVILHVLRLDPRNPGQLPIIGQGTQSVFGPNVVDQANDLPLIIGDRGICCGNVDALTRLDQIIVFDLCIGVFDLAESNFIFDRDLPQAIAGYNGMYSGGRCVCQKRGYR